MYYICLIIINKLLVFLCLYAYTYQGYIIIIATTNADFSIFLITLVTLLSNLYFQLFNIKKKYMNIIRFSHKM